MKKSYLFILLFIATISLIACENNSSLDDKDESSIKHLPTLKVVSENKSIKAEVGTSSWTITNDDGTKTKTITDTESPIDLVKEKNPLEVSSESTLKLDFSVKPKEMIVNIWQDNEQTDQVSTDMKIVVPDSKGLFIYEVIANWEEGTVHYVFSVDTK